MNDFNYCVLFDDGLLVGIDAHENFMALFKTRKEADDFAAAERLRMPGLEFIVMERVR